MSELQPDVLLWNHYYTVVVNMTGSLPSSAVRARLYESLSNYNYVRDVQPDMPPKVIDVGDYDLFMRRGRRQQQELPYVKLNVLLFSTKNVRLFCAMNVLFSCKLHIL